MADSYTVSGDQEAYLTHLYDRVNTLEPMERTKPLFWNEMKAVPNSKPGGDGLRFLIVGAKGHGNGAPGETGDWATPHTRQQVQCTVTSAQLDSAVAVSMKYMSAAQGQGSFTGDPENDLVLEAMDSLLTWGDVLVGAGFGTGQLGTVFANVAVDNEVRCVLPEGVYQFRENQPIDFVDGGGVVQASTVILSINYQTQTLTLEDNVTVTAGWLIYQANTFGSSFPNGLRSIVDNGDLAASIYTKSRTTYPYLNAVVVDRNGQDFSEDSVDLFVDQITYGQDLIPTQFRSNKGLASAYKARLVADRTFLQQPQGAPPDYQSGSAKSEDLAYLYGTQKISWKVDRNLPARELYALYMPAWGRNILREPDWVPGPGGKPFMLAPAAGGETYSYKLIGSLMMDINVRNTKPKAQGKMVGIKDIGSAGIEDA